MALFSVPLGEITSSHSLLLAPFGDKVKRGHGWPRNMGNEISFSAGRASSVEPVV